MSAYATTAMLIARVGGANANRTITANTAPTLTEVQYWLDGAEAMVLGALRAAGCNIPDAGTEGGLQIAEWALDYAEGHTRMAWVAGIDQDNDGMELIEGFKRLVREDIIQNGSFYCGMINGGDVSATGRRFKSYITDNTDDKTAADGDFAPQFERDEKW